MTDLAARGPAPGSGSPGLRRLRGPTAALLASVLLVGCAGPRGAPEPRPPEPPANGAPEPTDERTGEAALERVRAALPAEPGLALHRADSLYFAFRTGSGGSLAPEALRLQVRAALAAGDSAGAVARLRELISAFPGARAAEGAPLQLARLQLARAEDPAALRVLLRRGEGDEERRAVMRRAAGAMSVAELEEAAAAASDPGTAGAERALVLAELARARARAGREEAARSAAEQALEADPEASDRRTARAVLDGAVKPAAGPVRLGVLMPESGRYAEVGRWVRRGIQVALDAASGPAAVEVVARDLSEGSAGPLLGDLEEAGVSAVLGPLRGEAFRQAARARTEPGLLVVTPTAASGTDAGRHAYALWQRPRRELDAAAALGRWAGSRLRPGPVGALYPRDDLGRRAYLRFRRGVGESRGGWVVASAAYDPATTTLKDPITEVSAFRPAAVYAAAFGTSSLLQMAPQLAYYGVRAAVVLGGPDWSRPGAVRRLDPVFTQYRIAATFAPPETEQGAREEFRAAYERKHHTTLRDNVLPMLGHDAALLVLRAVSATRPARPRALSRAFGRLAGVEGATGVLSPEAGSGTVRRRIGLGALEDRRIQPATAEEARTWLGSAGRLELAGARGRRSRALRAVREAEIPLERSRSDAPEGGEQPR